MPSQIRRSPGTAMPAPTLKYGQTFGPYVITGFAGSGATSYVYKARRKDRFEPVAIKVLHPHLVADHRKRLTFYREARIMMRMQHPNVVRFEEIIEEGDVLAFVMEYIDGVTLSEWRESVNEEIDELNLACVFVDVLRGVAAAHSEGVVHRDLKPANILITELEGRAVAKIIDFGVARFVDQAPTEQESSKIVGTAAYISPEEVGNPTAVGHASDLYSIGVMLYEAACGRRPFEGMDVKELLEAHVKVSPARPRAVNPGVSTSMEEVILKTLDKDPSARFSTAPEMIQALEKALQDAWLRETVGIDPQSLVETAQWNRESFSPASLEQAAVQAQKSVRIRSFFKRCLEAAFTLMASPGLEEKQGHYHYLGRPGDAQMPFR